VAEAWRPLSGRAGENPYTVHAEVQQTMQRPGRHHPHAESELEIKAALAELEKLRERAAEGQRAGRARLQPGLAPGHSTCANMLLIAECVAQAAPWNGAGAAAATPATTTRP
jgi:succinate dehydrogenase / fumarate reductase, flavoprotein subunit